MMIATQRNGERGVILTMRMEPQFCRIVDAVGLARAEAA